MQTSFNKRTKTTVATAIGPDVGSFINLSVRAFEPKPPSQASAESAKPSRCKAPVNHTHVVSIKAALIQVLNKLLAISAVIPRISPSNKPIIGYHATDLPKVLGSGKGSWPAGSQLKN
jgi:hypothetical protein